MTTEKHTSDDARAEATQEAVDEAIAAIERDDGRRGTDGTSEAV